jgi:ferredoxin-thioredoxin reductase catalytic subunit
VSADAGITRGEAEALRAELARDAESGGYHLNPDDDFARALAEGLLVNERRLGYRCCPCRLGSGKEESDRDIVCPCDYRDADLEEWGACYCALYVSQEVLDRDRELGSIPERRPPEGVRSREMSISGGGVPESPGTVPVWRCRVCGYLCAREAPPETCPICKAKRERFERFWG